MAEIRVVSIDDAEESPWIRPTVTFHASGDVLDQISPSRYEDDFDAFDAAFFMVREDQEECQVIAQRYVHEPDGQFTLLVDVRSSRFNAMTLSKALLEFWRVADEAVIWRAEPADLQVTRGPYAAETVTDEGRANQASWTF